MKYILGSLLLMAVCINGYSATLSQQKAMKGALDFDRTFFEHTLKEHFNIDRVLFKAPSRAQGTITQDEIKIVANAFNDCTGKTVNSDQIIGNTTLIDCVNVAALKLSEYRKKTDSDQLKDLVNLADYTASALTVDNVKILSFGDTELAQISKEFSNVKSTLKVKGKATDALTADEKSTVQIGFNSCMKAGVDDYLKKTGLTDASTVEKSIKVAWIVSCTYMSAGSLYQVVRKKWTLESYLSFMQTEIGDAFTVISAQ
ncbi:MAG: hypothetical protein WCQ53_02170 [bacterium]